MALQSPDMNINAVIEECYERLTGLLLCFDEYIGCDRVSYSKTPHTITPDEGAVCCSKVEYD